MCKLVDVVNSPLNPCIFGVTAIAPFIVFDKCTIDLLKSTEDITISSLAVPAANVVIPLNTLAPVYSTTSQSIVGSKVAGKVSIKNSKLVADVNLCLIVSPSPQLAPGFSQLASIYRCY